MSVDMQGAGGPVARTEAWKTLATAMAQVLGDTVSLSLEVADTVPTLEEASISMFVRLVDVEHALDFDFVVAAPLAVAAELATAMVGDPIEDEETVREVLGELVNIAGGSVKTQFDREKFPLTMGIPRGMSEPPPPYLCYQAIGLTASSGGFLVSLGVRGCPESLKKASALREGMVLAEEVREGEELNFPRGFRLTGSSVDRLKQLGDRELRVIEIG